MTSATRVYGAKLRDRGNARRLSGSAMDRLSGGGSSGVQSSTRPRAARDAKEAIAFVREHAKTRDLQEACVRALVAKCTILWGMLDAIAEARA